MLDHYEDLVIRLRRKHSKTWREKPESYWFARLTQEVGELGSALVGDHADPPDWELVQIATICLNWLEMRGAAPESIKRSSEYEREAGK